MTKAKTKAKAKQSIKEERDLTHAFIAGGIGIGAIAITVALVLYFSDKIVIDPCASSCTKGSDVCIEVCREVTLHDYLFGNK